MIVKVRNDDRLFVIKYRLGQAVTLTTFFPTYSPNGGAVFETYIVEADQVIQLGSPTVSESTDDYDFQVGDRVHYIGTVKPILDSLQGQILTVCNIGRKDIGCIRDGETHLRFFAPSLLQKIVETDEMIDF